MAKANVDILIRAKDRYSREFGRFGRSATGLRSTMRRLAAGAAVYFSGRALLGFAKASVQASANFRKSMGQVHTMLDEGSEHLLPRYRREILAMSSAFGESTETLAKGLYDILSASVAADKAMGVLKVAARAAVGGATETSIAVDGLTSILNAYGLSADQAAHVSDVMFATVKRGKINFTQLASNIGKVAPMAHAAEMELEDMLAALATMTRQGVSAEEAATQLRSILKTLPESGRDLLAVVERFRGRTLAEIIGEVPEQRAARGIAALAADIEGLRRDLELLDSAAGAADEAFEKMANTRRWNRLGAAWQSLKIQMGDLAERSEWMGDSIEGLIRRLEDFPDQFALAMLHAKHALAALRFELGAMVGLEGTGMAERMKQMKEHADALRPFYETLETRRTARAYKEMQHILPGTSQMPPGFGPALTLGPELRPAEVADKTNLGDVMERKAFPGMRAGPAERAARGVAGTLESRFLQYGPDRQDPAWAKEMIRRETATERAMQRQIERQERFFDWLETHARELTGPQLAQILRGSP